MPEAFLDRETGSDWMDVVIPQSAQLAYNPATGKLQYLGDDGVVREILTEWPVGSETILVMEVDVIATSVPADSVLAGTALIPDIIPTDIVLGLIAPEEYSTGLTHALGGQATEEQSCPLTFINVTAGDLSLPAGTYTVVVLRQLPFPELIFTGLADQVVAFVGEAGGPPIRWIGSF